MKLRYGLNRAQKWYIHETEAVEAIFGECFNYKSDLRILIFPLKVPFSGIKDGHFWRKLTVFGPRKNGTSSGRIKIKILQFKHSPNMAYTPLISWISNFWARFWPYFNFVDFWAYFGRFSLVKKGKYKMSIDWFLELTSWH